MEVPAGDTLIGRVVNPLEFSQWMAWEHRNRYLPSVETPAPGVMQQKSVSSAFKPVWKPLMPSFQSDGANEIDHRRPSNRKPLSPSIPSWTKRIRHDLSMCGGQKINGSGHSTETLHRVMGNGLCHHCRNSINLTTVSLCLPRIAGVTMARKFMLMANTFWSVYDDLSKQAVAYRGVPCSSSSAGRETSQGMSSTFIAVVERSAKYQMNWVVVPSLRQLLAKQGDISLYTLTWFSITVDKMHTKCAS